MFRSRSWFGSSLWKPKNPHSLEHLKYLYNVLSKNQTVSEHNRGLLVESLRSIAEILIWGDQNDSSVFDFFLEKNMLSFFLKIMKQKCGSYVCVQLLQTLNILFENIRNETSLYYLLSNNHVNSIIVHKFDFSDEEVMAYYISFLKTLSLKLNTHTIHFFYNEHTNDFPLYTEAIKFFNHPETMVRIAVRTLTLNVYRVDDKSMLKFIRDRTAAPYFSNLVWFIGNHILELDLCVRNDADHQSQARLADLVAEHLDHLHYLSDIMCLDIASLNQVLTDHLLNKLLIPLYVFSLTSQRPSSESDSTEQEVPGEVPEDHRPHVSGVVSLFLLSQVFLIIGHPPLVQALAWVIFHADFDIFSETKSERFSFLKQFSGSKPGFVPPSESLEQSLGGTQVPGVWKSQPNSLSGEGAEGASSSLTSEAQLEENAEAGSQNSASESGEVHSANITDEEKQQRRTLDRPLPEFSLANRPFLEASFSALDISESDYAALFGLCLLYAMGHNNAVNQEILDSVYIPTDRSESKQWYNVNLVERLICIISNSCKPNSRVRLVALELAILLLKQLVVRKDQSFLQDRHLAAVEGAKEESTLVLRNFYKSEEIFLDMFEDEYMEMHKRPLNVEWLTMDSNILLPPTGTPMTGIDFGKRLPCGEVERARRAIRVFFLIRDLSLTLGMATECQLPLTNPSSCVQVNDVLDLNNSDLIACSVVYKDGSRIRRFLVIDVIQLILVEPDSRRLGWGIAKFVGFLQDIEVLGDKDDSRTLHITIHRPQSAFGTANRVPLLSAKFLFDDHIRCMAAKQRLTKGRLKARQKKMHQIAKLLDLPSSVQPGPGSPTLSAHGLRIDGAYRRSGSRDLSLPAHRPIFSNSGTRVPGFAAVMKREVGVASGSGVAVAPGMHVAGERGRPRSGSRSRDASPRLPRPRSEEIPLEDMSLSSSSSRAAAPSSSKRRHRSGSSSHCGRHQGGETVGGGSTVRRRWSMDLRSTKGHIALLPSPLLLQGVNSKQLTPKTLRPAEVPPLSLLHTETISPSVTVSSAVLLPPVDVKKITHSSTAVIKKQTSSTSVQTTRKAKHKRNLDLAGRSEIYRKTNVNVNAGEPSHVSHECENCDVVSSEDLFDGKKKCDVTCNDDNRVISQAVDVGEDVNEEEERVSETSFTELPSTASSSNSNIVDGNEQTLAGAEASSIKDEHFNQGDSINRVLKEKSECSQVHRKKSRGTADESKRRFLRKKKGAVETV